MTNNPAEETTKKIKAEKQDSKEKSVVNISNKKMKIDFDKPELEKKTEKVKIKKEIEGIVVSDKMDKTIIALVSTIKIHPLYGKRYRRDRRYSVHDPLNKYKVGEKVTFIPSKPYSKNKRWEVVN